MMRWERGRLGTGYEKLKLFSSARLRCDAWLLRSEPSIEVPEHVDVVPGMRHYRANVVLLPARVGGIFAGEHVLIDWPRLKVFRSDRKHRVSKIEVGQRLVLSLGLCLLDRTTVGSDELPW